MKLDELQSVQSRERQTDQLQQLRATFYEEAGQFVQQLREERDRAADRADDPFDSPEVNRLTDDIKTAEQTVEAIYERRVGKIVKMASLAAADMPTEEDGLTQEERDLFETMVDAIQANRGHVLDVIAGEAPTGTVGDGETETSTDVTAPDASATSDDGVDPADMMGGSPDRTEAPADESGPVSDEAPVPDEPRGSSDKLGADEASTATESDADRPTDEATAAIDDALSEADVLASPTMPIPPMERGESLDDPLTMYLADANTTPVNLANLPAISVPAGETDDGLPVGLQLVGPAFGERTIIRAGSALA